MAGTSTPEPGAADMARACGLLSADEITAAAVKGDAVLTSKARGVRPLLEWVSAGTSLEGFSVADKVVGKAPALLYCLLGPRAVHAPVMSFSAEKVLVDRGIVATCDLEVDTILNAQRTGQCPIDASVASADEPEAGLAAIRGCLKRLAGTGGPASRQ
ncbi:protein of unknown function [Olsenella sp. KH3B4]|uniref:DUF1893 domain-containing protein n=1 Tax=Olsenella sp. KH3B4 TaxID=1855394 RepID=UPI0008CE6A98|nr:DUF1893 domain-containing protein [Olsenella sp. KH3B4]SES71977.1 protein of unknown function [Olsenella sp. KH3B4]